MEIFAADNITKLDGELSMNGIFDYQRVAQEQ